MASIDERWIAGARECDSTVLAEIYDALSPELYRYAYRLLGQREAAEDALAETFLRFLRIVHSGGGPSQHVRAYLYRILHNLAMDSHRRGFPGHDSLDAAPITAENMDPLHSAAEIISAEQARSAVWRLTPGQRQVILLRYFQGLGSEEIARVVDKPVGAVKALQHRALNALRRIMQREHGWEIGET
jgi:RNA polymerase sigma-70 factor (ECF subfamily)